MDGKPEKPDWEDQLNLEAFRAAKEARNLEISLFWQRSNYFLVLNTAIAAGFLSSKDARSALVLAVLGLLSSALWVAITLGGKFWQARWEYRTRLAEKRVMPGRELYAADWETIQEDVIKSFNLRQHGRVHRLYQWCVLRKPSVSMAMTMLALLFICFWIASAVTAIARVIR